jgi:PleD family two-component response regulator
MKIVIFNEDLRSEMQMYLALSNHYDVTIAEDEDDLLQLLDRNSADFTFLDLDCGEERPECQKRLDIATIIRRKHPGTQVVGICDSKDKNLTDAAAGHGINKMVTRPIKNRELLEVIG